MFTTVGHQKQKDFLQQLLEKKQYSHAYLFTGPSEIGKRTLAVEFAAAILEISSKKPVAEIQHPDLMQIDASTLAIADMRELLTTLSYAPFSAQKKVVIFDNFEHASREVSNALLKTIEEPSAATIIILIAENYKALLPTVISRTQRLHFAIPAEGRIGRTIRMTTDKEYTARFNGSLSRLEKLKRTSPAERLLAIKDLADLEDAELSELIRWWGESEQSKLAEHPHTYANLMLFANAESALRRYFNKKLVLQKIVLDLIP